MVTAAKLLLIKLRLVASLAGRTTQPTGLQTPHKGRTGHVFVR